MTTQVSKYYADAVPPAEAADQPDIVAYQAVKHDTSAIALRLFEMGYSKHAILRGLRATIANIEDEWFPKD